MESLPELSLYSTDALNYADDEASANTRLLFYLCCSDGQAHTTLITGVDETPVIEGMAVLTIR